MTQGDINRIMKRATHLFVSGEAKRAERLVSAMLNIIHKERVIKKKGWGKRTQGAFSAPPGKR